MNYKLQIEKTAAQAMPFKRPDGTWARPRGYQKPSYTAEDYNRAVKEYYSESGENASLSDDAFLPDGAEVIGEAPWLTDGIAATPDNKLFYLNPAMGMHREFSDDHAKHMYATTDHEFSDYARKIDRKALNSLDNYSMKKQMNKLHGLGIPNTYKHDRNIVAKNSLGGVAAGTASALLLAPSIAQNRLSGKKLLLGTGVGAIAGGLMGASKGMNKSRGRYVAGIESKLRDAHEVNSVNDEFLSQYR